MQAKVFDIGSATFVQPIHTKISHPPQLKVSSDTLPSFVTLSKFGFLVVTYVKEILSVEHKKHSYGVISFIVCQLILPITTY